MKTKFLLLTFLIIGSMAAYSQTTPPSTKSNLEKAKANPRIKEQQAKADVHVVKKTQTIVDTTPMKQAGSSAIIAPSQKKKPKKS